jgi:putative ABC transport system ATP-binding protein
LEPIITCRDLKKKYGNKDNVFYAVNGIDLDIYPKEFVSLSGPSGSGKTTLLNLLSGLDIPDEGSVMLASKELNLFSKEELAEFRLNHIGFIFQAYNLIPVLSAKENVEFIMQLQGVNASQREKRALQMLEEVGLKGLEHRRPSELSGGQQQRVAIARAIASKPSIVFADEPSANLDSKSTDELLKLMSKLNEKFEMTFCIASHDQKVIDYTKRRIIILDGKVQSDEKF